MAMNGMPAALLLDLDGTLVESEHLWQMAQKETVEGLGGVWSDALNQELIGTGLLWSAERMRDHSGSTEDPHAIGERILETMVSLIDGGGAEVMPGGVHLLTLAEELGIPVAVVTSSYRVLAEASLHTVGDYSFAAVITGDEVTRAKPHPEPYLRAASALRVPVERSVAFEDSDVGVRSALSSGAITVAVPNHIRIDPEPGLTILESLEYVTADWLAQLMNAR